jgi:hypothetical protein
MLEQELLNDIESKLNNISTSYTNRAKANDLFEAFVFTILIEAAIKEGAIRPIYFEDTSGRRTSSILFRRSPGYINDKSIPYTHAVLTFPMRGDDWELEVHIGIYAAGSSKVPQECDIAVLLRKEGERCRKIYPNKAVVKSTNILIGVECKCHQYSKVALGSGRSFLGLVQDFSSNGKYFFVFNNEKFSVEKMLSHYDKEWEHNLSPTSAKEVERLRNVFQDRFKKFKYKYC